MSTDMYAGEVIRLVNTSQVSLKWFILVTNLCSFSIVWMAWNSSVETTFPVYCVTTIISGVLQNIRSWIFLKHLSVLMEEIGGFG